MKIPLAIFYFGMTTAIDISLFIAIYGNNPLVRFICGNLAFLLFIMILIFGLILASISTKAHWSYELMNSLIATRKIPLRSKFKVIFKTYIRYKTLLDNENNHFRCKDSLNVWLNKQLVYIFLTHFHLINTISIR